MGLDKDLTGMTFDHLQVVERVQDTQNTKNSRWLCRCDCGADIVVYRSNLTSGNTKSCGSPAHRFKPDRPRPFSPPDPARGKIVNLTRTYRCKRCKKEFERPATGWGWTIGNDKYCTYRCMREQEKEDMGKCKIL